MAGEVRMLTTENNGVTLAGQWMLYNTASELMIEERDEKYIAFREIILPEAMRNCKMEDVKCCADHEEVSKYLGRTPNALRLIENERGWAYECDLLLGTPTADEVRGYVERGDYVGNSFKFFVKKDRWERQSNGQFLRYVEEIYAVQHVGPVKNPAYVNTDVAVAYRSLENSGLLVETIESNEQKPDLEARKRMLNLKLKITKL